MKIGNYNSTADRQIDIKQKLPNDYKNLKKENFIIINAKMSCTNIAPADQVYDIIDAYDSETGILDLKRSWIRAADWYMWVEYTIGCILGEVEVVESIE